MMGPLLVISRPYSSVDSRSRTKRELLIASEEQSEETKGEDSEQSFSATENRNYQAGLNKSLTGQTIVLKKYELPQPGVLILILCSES